MFSVQFFQPFFCNILTVYELSGPENPKERIENDIEFREKLIRLEIALNEEGFGPSGLHLQAIARKR